MKKLLAISLAFIIYSCSPVLKIQKTFQSPDVDFNHLKSSKIILGGVTSISLSEFVNTFNYEYSTTSKLNDKIFTIFCNQFALKLPNVSFDRLNSKIPEFLSGDFLPKELKSEKATEFFNDLESDYLLLVKHVDVGHTYNSYLFSSEDGVIYSGQTEKCVVSIYIEIWDVVNQQRIMDFYAGGDDSVSLFSYLAALEGAIKNSVTTAVEYIVNEGTT